MTMNVKRATTRNARVAISAAALVALVLAATAVAAPPREVSQPTIEGGPFYDGRTVRAGTGVWANRPTSYAYRWQRCDANAGTNCRNIGGATDSRYRLRQADVGRSVRVLVTARNADGARTANSKPSPVISDNTPPQNTAAPSITGGAVVGGQLTAVEGSWTSAPTRYAYQWLQCDALGNACGAIAGATGKIYGVRSADTGRTLRVEVTAVNPYGRRTATSAQTGIVRTSGAGPGPAVPVAAVALPLRLVISAVSFSPGAIPNRATTMTLRVRVNDTSGRLVSGALVLASGIPFGRVTTMPETATDGNGIATLRFRATTRLPIRRNTAVQFFLRARKPGENPLAGVSTRRLVQVRIVPS
jgi:hypothetical protein